MSDKKTIRKNINFPYEVVAKINHFVKEQRTDFSKFVRDAAEERIKKLEKEKLERELIEGYKANAELDKRTCDDFKYIDSENI